MRSGGGRSAYKGTGVRYRDDCGDATSRLWSTDTTLGDNPPPLYPWEGFPGGMGGNMLGQPQMRLLRCQYMVSSCQQMMTCSLPMPCEQLANG
jgi:hypothetical protein